MFCVEIVDLMWGGVYGGFVAADCDGVWRLNFRSFQPCVRLGLVMSWQIPWSPIARGYRDGVGFAVFVDWRWWLCLHGVGFGGWMVADWLVSLLGLVLGS